MSEPRATDSTANFPQVEEGRAVSPPISCLMSHVSCLVSCVLCLVSCVYESCVLMMTKAKRNTVNRSGQDRRKAKSGMFNPAPRD
jgi:hypothetical protein